MRAKLRSWRQLRGYPNNRPADAGQVQRWLGHHSPLFTLTVYVHLLGGDLGGPLTMPPTAAGRSPEATTSGVLVGATT